MADLPLDDLERVIPWDELGFPKPKNNPPSKQAVREAIRIAIMPHMGALVSAQVAQACGIKYLVARDADGKFKRIGRGAFEAMVDDGESIIEVWEKDPSTPAFTDLMNRAIDKPKEQEQEVVVHDGDKIRERLNAWKLAHRSSEDEP